MKDIALVVGAGLLGLAAVTLGKGSKWFYEKQARLLSIAFTPKSRLAEERPN